MNPVLPPASAILASLGQAAFVWDIASDRLVWSEHVAAVFPDIPLERLASGAEFSNLIEPQRSVRSEALVASPPAHGVRRRALPDRIWREGQYLGAGAMDRGDRLLVCRRRRQAGARPGHRPDQQRAPRPRRAARQTVAERSPDRRTQSHASDRFARRDHRGGRSFPHQLRLHADRHRSSGAHQRRLRLRCRGCGDFGSGGPHSPKVARRRRARAFLRQQVRPGAEELHGRRHERRGRAVSGRDPRRGGADQIRPRLGHGLDRRRQRAALCPQCRRGDQPRPGNPRRLQEPPRRVRFRCGARMSSATPSAG